MHPVSFRSDHSGYDPILLGGRSWQVTRIDWRRGFADVVPDSRPGRSRWNGDARPLRGELCREMRACLAGSDIPARLTRRGAQTLEDSERSSGGRRMAHRHRRGRAWKSTLVDVRRSACERGARRSPRGPLTREPIARQPLDRLAIGLTSVDLDAGLRSLRDPATLRPGTTRDASFPKFAECLPADLATSTVAIRYTDTESVKACLDERIGSWRRW